MHLTEKLTCLFLVGTLLLTGIDAGVPISQFYPFGVQKGDQLLAAGDDSYSTAIAVDPPFPFLGRRETKVFVNVNGAVSFDSGVSTYTPVCQANGARIRMVAPFWADVDTRYFGGNVTYRATKDSQLLTKANNDIVAAYPNIESDFQPVSLFIITWFNVSYYKATDCSAFGAQGPTNDKVPRNSFQAVLATDGLNKMFAIFYYNKITWTTGGASGGVSCTGFGGTPAKIGFDAGDGKTFYAVSGSCTGSIVQVSDSSNCDSPGKWVFRTDSATSIVDQIASIRISPPVVNIFGGDIISVTGPLFNVSASATCFFQDTVIGTRNVTGSVVMNGSVPTVRCRVPLLHDVGNIAFNLSLIDSRLGSSLFKGILTVAHTRAADVTETLIRINGELHSPILGIRVKWDPNAAQLRSTSTVDVALLYINNLTKRWKTLTVLASGVENNGLQKVLLKASPAFNSGALGDMLWTIAVYQSGNNGNSQDAEASFNDPSFAIINSPAIFCGKGMCKMVNVNNDPSAPMLAKCESYECALRNRVNQLQRRKRQSLDSSCNQPTGRDCSWYDTCLARAHPGCPDGEEYARSYALYYCSAYSSNYNSFSDDGKQWVDNVRLCLQQAATPLLDSSISCADVKQRALDSHADCYTQSSPDICGLSPGDYARIMKNTIGAALQEPADYFSNAYDVGKHCAKKKICPLCDQVKTLCDLGLGITPSFGLICVSCQLCPPPTPGTVYGDPHFHTFDGLYYVFNGRGEFWLIFPRRGVRRSVPSVQGRLAALSSWADASYLTALTLKVPHSTSPTTIQVQQSSIRGLDVLVNGSSIFADSGSSDSQYLYKHFPGFSLFVTSDRYTVSIATLGMSLVIRKAAATLTFMPLMNSQFKGMVSGLYGNFNGNPDDDLTGPDGSSIPTTSSANQIHTQMMKWMIKSSDQSFFTYTPGTSYGTFSYPNYTPRYYDARPESASPAAIAVCGNSVQCLYDYQATSGNSTMAKLTLNEQVTFTQRLNETNTTVSKLPVCSRLSKPENGVLKAPSGFTVGTTVVVACQPGYNLVGSDGNRKQEDVVFLICKNDKTWSEQLPSCEPSAISTQTMPPTRMRSTTRPPTTSNCANYQWQCPNSDRCISGDRVCDQHVDCPGARDETNCETGNVTCCDICMKCRNGRCIYRDWMCDGVDQCGDGTDEMHCTGNCGAEAQVCRGDGRCLLGDLFCDGNYNCPDQSDEKNCLTKPCCDNCFKCSSDGKCIWSSSVCDGQSDCSDGSDETGCKYRPCDSGKYKCNATNKCLRTSEVCEGGVTPADKNWCENYGDRRCNTGRCVSLSNICNGVDDCGDGSDERFCRSFECATGTEYCPEKKMCLRPGNSCRTSEN